jgi:hypothetical protein
MWNLREGKMIRTIKLPGISCIHHSYDGQFNYIGFEDGKIEVRSNSKRVIDHCLQNFGSKVTCIADNQKYVAFSAENGSIIMYNKEENDY